MKTQNELTDLLVHPVNRKVRETRDTARSIVIPPRARVYTLVMWGAAGGGAGRLPWRRYGEGVAHLPSTHSVSDRTARRRHDTYTPPSRGPALILSCHSSTVYNSYCCFGTWPRAGPPRPKTPCALWYQWRGWCPDLLMERPPLNIFLLRKICLLNVCNPVFPHFRRAAHSTTSRSMVVSPPLSWCTVWRGFVAFGVLDVVEHHPHCTVK